MTKKEFIQQACLSLMPMLFRYGCGAKNTKTSFETVFTCADLMEQISKEKGVSVFDDDEQPSNDGEQPSTQHPYSEWDYIPITNLCIDNSGGARTRFLRVCRYSEINSIGDLLRIGSRDFRKFRDIGDKTYYAIQEALESQYGITNF